MKYILFFQRKGKKIMVENTMPYDEMKEYVKSILNQNNWKKVDIYINNLISPNMENAYSHKETIFKNF